MTSTIVGKTAKSVTAVEIIADFPKANVATNGHLQNITFFCQDVMNLEAEPNSFDVIFSNWIFMYLGDGEVKELAKKAIKWLRPGGKLLFRESCFRQYGDIKRNSNPTYYRHPSFYVGVFGSLVSKKENGELGYFNLDSYTKATKRGAGGNDEAVATFQTFLDQHQYFNQSITRYEKIFGQGYVSTGGQTTTTEFVKMLSLKAGERVLDVGCGIGRGDFYMARQFGVSVVGIDLSSNMVHRALETSVHDPNTDVEFEICDATKGEQESTNIFKAYVAGRGYHLLSPAQYGKVLESVGFTSVVAEDRTKQFVECLEYDACPMGSEIKYIVDGWEEKIVRCGDGDQKWGLFYGRRSSKYRAAFAYKSLKTV
ncbi:Phosphoethanolamine N-methyltransferase [Phytophthora cinnamomi]|uniref:Phosphoethanolamine N-methyltransferase n=1 Tax=Phytophthora cinnamomi TaxID=4785 RepID=UPI00355983BA|nr:Phosphoethanolamine N-methyltransferase [Phytophthora cinnamomi]